MKTVLFACVHNAGRSQMAAALFNALVDPQLARAISAGTQPAEQVHPEVVEAMLETGIDLSPVQPLQLTPALASQADLLVTMGCEEACPAIPGLEQRDWPLTDPKGRATNVVQSIRDEIHQRVNGLLCERNWIRSL